jgi:hypothetical protein
VSDSASQVAETAHDDGQQIVEVVRDGACHMTE